MKYATLKILDEPVISGSLRQQVGPAGPVFAGGDDCGDDVLLLVPGEGWPRANGWADLFAAEPPPGLLMAINATSFCSVSTGTVWHLTVEGWLDSGHPCAIGDGEPEADGVDHQPCPFKPLTLDDHLSDYLIKSVGIVGPVLRFSPQKDTRSIIRLSANIVSFDCRTRPSYCRSINSDTICKRNVSGSTKGHKWYRCYDDGGSTSLWEKTSDSCRCP